MKIDRTKKRKVLNLLLITLLATLLVSASLSSMQLQAGLPFPGGEGAKDDLGTLPDTHSPEPVFRSVSPGTLLIIPSLFLIFILFLIFRHAEGRRILSWALLFCLFIGLIVVLFGDGQTIGGFYIPPQEAPSGTSRVGPIGSAPPIFVWLVIGGFVLLAGIFGFWLYRTTFKVISTKNLIKEEAKNALKEIKDGREWRNVIIRCYMQMVRVLQTERGIERDDSMTTQEFEKFLISHNFPEKAVHSLTTLFEKVRYGNKLVDSDDEQTAVDCLTAITGSIAERRDRTC